MGGVASGLQKFTKVQKLRVLMLGLQGAGKTSVLKAMKLGDVVTTTPTDGLDIRTVTHKAFRTSVTISVVDVGGADGDDRPCWLKHVDEPNAFIFVVDSRATEGLEESRVELERLLSLETLQEVPVLVFATQQDHSEALAASQVAQQLQLHSIQGRRWCIQGINHRNDGPDGIFKGLDWLIEVLHSGGNKAPSRQDSGETKLTGSPSGSEDACEWCGDQCGEENQSGEPDQGGHADDFSEFSLRVDSPAAEALRPEAPLRVDSPVAEALHPEVATDLPSQLLDTSPRKGTLEVISLASTMDHTETGRSAQPPVAVYVEPEIFVATTGSVPLAPLVRAGQGRGTGS